MKDATQSGKMEMDTEIVLGKKITVITFAVHKQSAKYFIGVQIARLLKRQTFNMYRSMKSKRIRVVRASPDQIKFLLKLGVVPRNTHSVTLVPYQDGLEFIADHWKREPPANVVPTAENDNVDPSVYVGYLEQCASVSLLLLSFADGDNSKSFKSSQSECAQPMGKRVVENQSLPSEELSSSSCKPLAVKIPHSAAGCFPVAPQLQQQMYYAPENQHNFQRYAQYNSEANEFYDRNYYVPNTSNIHLLLSSPANNMTAPIY